MRTSRPRIVESKDDRWYIVFYITNEIGQKRRKRIYSSRDLGIKSAGYGNRTGVSIIDKREYFAWLLEQVAEKIKSGWEPVTGSIENKTVKNGLKSAADLILKSGSGTKHKENIEYWRITLLKYFSHRYQIYNAPIETLDNTHLEAFLSDTCGSSNGYYNAARKNVSALFGLMVRHGLLKKNPLSGISARKHIPVKNKAFTQVQIRSLLEYCKSVHFNLYAALVMEFTLLLRPHSEIRKLSRGMFNKDLSMLKIPAGYTKGARSRELPLNKMVRQLLYEMKLNELSSEENIFSKSSEPFNQDYFATQWSSFKKKAIPKGLIQENQTLYSMRHSAALHVYEQTKSIKKVQKLMDHADVKTTFAYMRSLGIDNDRLEIEDMPNLEV